MSDVFGEYLKIRTVTPRLIKFWQAVPRERFPEYFLVVDAKKKEQEAIAQKLQEEEEERKSLGRGYQTLGYYSGYYSGYRGSAGFAYDLPYTLG